MTLQEKWRPVPGFPGYLVSDQGRVTSKRYGPSRILRPALTRSGYEYVSLWREADGKQRTIRVHAAVAAAFHGPRPEGLATRHLDGNKLNNAASNLQYGTLSENTLDQVLHGVHNQASKTECRAGHPYDEENTRNLADGSRECKKCRREIKRRYRERLAQRSVAAPVERAS